MPTCDGSRVSLADTHPLTVLLNDERFVHAAILVNRLRQGFDGVFCPEQFVEFRFVHHASFLTDQKLNPRILRIEPKLLDPDHYSAIGNLPPLYNDEIAIGRRRGSHLSTLLSV